VVDVGVADGHPTDDPFHAACLVTAAGMQGAVTGHLRTVEGRRLTIKAVKHQVRRARTGNPELVVVVVVATEDFIPSAAFKPAQ